MSALIIQMPLPTHINKNRIRIIKNIAPHKDADCLHPLNFGKFMQDENSSLIAPPTPAAIIKLLEEYQISIAGKKAVIVGRSNIVGKPAAQMLLNRNTTVTISHSKTKDLKTQAKKADILVSAVGKIGLIDEQMIKKGAVVVDVGVNRRRRKICGDVIFESVAKKAGFLTPVPGGLGPLTIAMLAKNIIKLEKITAEKITEVRPL